MAQEEPFQYRKILRKEGKNWYDKKAQNYCSNSHFGFCVRFYGDECIGR